VLAAALAPRASSRRQQAAVCGGWWEGVGWGMGGGGGHGKASLPAALLYVGWPCCGHCCGSVCPGCCRLPRLERERLPLALPLCCCAACGPCFCPLRSCAPALPCCGEAAEQGARPAGVQGRLQRCGPHPLLVTARHSRPQLPQVRAAALLYRCRYPAAALPLPCRCPAAALPLPCRCPAGTGARTHLFPAAA
jgi:hypothetical protein